jgi:predicted DsbA family dithiol-disulfide isomerase
MNNNKITIEFFHDVLCAWCYVLSPRVKKLVQKYPDEIILIHRAFALAPSERSLEYMFDSKESAKQEILEHWRAANENDTEHRINADLMETRDFDYPYSMPGLLACKAAEMQGGNEKFGEMMDRLQKAHLTECLNINNDEILMQCAKDIGLNTEQWYKDYKSEKARELVLEDLALARKYNVNSVPTLVANEREKFIGAQPYESLEAWFLSLKNK